MQPIAFVPDLITVAHLLAEFQRRRLRFAVVVDEFGGTAGVVTLEDVVEEIVGDVFAPVDREASPLVQIGPDEYRVAGDLSVREWAEIFRQRSLPHPVHTIAGLIAALLGRVPRVGDVVRMRNLVLMVEAVQRRRVRWARVRREAPSPDTEESAQAGEPT
jgi:CBS domain containing-hemolysin-like protein